MRIILTYFLSLTLVSIADAMLQGPRLLNVCIDRNTNTVTIEWSPVIDDCGSFNALAIYGNENGGVFTQIATIANLNQYTYSYILPNANLNRTYYLSTSYRCDGALAISDTVKIDLLPPATITLDSASFDPLTKKLTLGWTKNPSTDTKGYNIYRYNGTAYVLIGNTSNTSFVVDDQQYNYSPLTIATYDSCLLTSAIGEPTHTPMQLTLEHNQCLRQNNLSWTLYNGWNIIDSQQLYISESNGSYAYISSLNSSQTEYSQNISLGANYCYYVRSFSNGMSASSNVSCIQTTALDTPQTLEILNVSVEEDNYIEITFRHSPPSSSKNININRRTNSEKTIKTYETVEILTNEIFTYQDFDVSVQDQLYYYQLTTQNSCDEINKSSNEATNILLLKEDNLLTFNEYIGYTQGVDQYKIGRSEINSSTWSTVFFVNPFAGNMGYEKEEESGCYRVNAVNTDESYQSKSNAICTADSFWVAVPNVINPTGTQNNRFAVYSNFIDHNNSTYTIYDRWGGVVHKGKTNEAWNVGPGEEIYGVYIYLVEALSLANEKKILKGSLTVLK